MATEIDTPDRLAQVREEINRLEQTASEDTKDFRSLYELEVKEKSLLNELGSGKYFAKSSDIFPKGDAVQKTIKDIKGAAKKFQRTMKLSLYEQQRNALVAHLNQDNTSVPDYSSLAPSEASVASSTSGLAHSSGNNQAKDKVQPRGMTVAAAADQPADPKACIIKHTSGHKGHQGSDSANCSAWWAPVYSWMIGNIEELEFCVKEMKETNQDEKIMLDRIYGALVMLATGSRGGTQGMRSSNRNILMVPNPHDEYYDAGCNWVIYPLMKPEDMVKWKGEPYYVAIFCGETIPEVNDKGNIWKVGPSKYGSEAAEKELLGDLHLHPEDLEICSTIDLGIVAEGLRDMALGLSDLHARELIQMNESSGPVFKARIIDLADSVRQYIVESRTKDLQRGLAELSEGLKNVATNYEELEKLAALTELSTELTDKATLRVNTVHEHDEIVAGINKLIIHLETNGIEVPKPPTKNHFGTDGKHVYKAKIQQKFPPDPIVVAAKGTNNFCRQWGLRLLWGCQCNPIDDDSSFGVGFSGGGNSSSSVVAGFAATPTTPDKDLIGFEFVVVTPEPYVDDDSCSNVSSY